jgi:hypothetical protein
MLDQFSNVDYNSAIQLDGMIVNLRPLTYGEFTETSRQTFDEQRIFKVLNDTDMAEGDKLATFTESFKKLTDLTILTLEKSIASIEVGDDVVTDQAHIKEFIANTDKGLFESVTNHIEEQRTKFQVKPLVVDATPEEIEAGVPETYEVPVTFDQSSFFV